MFATNGSQGFLFKMLVLLDLPPPFVALFSIFVKYGINSETRIFNGFIFLEAEIGLVNLSPVEEHRSLGGSIISMLDNGAFFGLIYSLLVFS